MPRRLTPKELELLLKREWPYEPGWYDVLRADFFRCVGDACVRRDAPSFVIGDKVYIGAGLGEVYCVSCFYERRRIPN